MLRNHVPTLHEVIPLIDNLNTYLEECADNLVLHASVRSGAAGGLVILDKYYAKMDDSIMYRLAMSESI
jgi:hypothetical protein